MLTLRVYLLMLTVQCSVIYLVLTILTNTGHQSIGVFSNDYDQVYLGASENALISSREKLSLI